MAEKESNNHDVSSQQVSENAPSSDKRKQYRALWILLIVFFAFVVAVFLFQRRDTIHWIEDYDAGIGLAKQQNKPVLLAIYKVHNRFCSLMSQNTYNNRDVIEYVQANFIPVLIDVDKQPEIAKRYKANSYPAHYIKRPDSDELFGPRLGYDPPSLFIKELRDLLERMEMSDK